MKSVLTDASASGLPSSLGFGAERTGPGTEPATMLSGTGYAVPPRVVPNSYFVSYLETTDEWIRDRTGIIERRWVEDTVSASELAEPACRMAIKNAGLRPDQIGGVIVATVTPDYIFPSTACSLQRRLGISGGLAFDVNAVCSGFVYALVTADSMIARGLAQNILVVGVDIYSRHLNQQDRTTCILFGDGAGAVVLSAAGGEPAVNGAAVERRPRGILGSVLHANGAHGDILKVPCGSANVPTPESLRRGDHALTMAGKEVFKLAVRHLGEVSEEVLRAVRLTPADIDYIVAHQANKRILDAVAKHLAVPAEKVLWNGDRYGNTSAASIPILLGEAVERGQVRPGQTLLLNAFGGGVTWGAVVLRY